MGVYFTITGALHQKLHLRQQKAAQRQIIEARADGRSGATATADEVDVFTGETTGHNPCC